MQQSVVIGVWVGVLTVATTAHLCHKTTVLVFFLAHIDSLKEIQHSSLCVVCVVHANDPLAR